MAMAHTFRVIERNALGDQFTQHQREIRNDDNDNCQRQALGIGGQKGDGGQQDRQAAAQGFIAHGADEDAHQSDAYLGGGKQPVGRARQFEGGLSLLLSIFGMLFKAGFAC
jgi:hypothetical protein